MSRRTSPRRDLAWALGALAVLAVVVLIAFVGRNPVSRPFEVHAVFANATQLKSGNPVRLAGITIGKVTGVERHGHDAARVTLRIDKPAGLHQNLSLAIEPRLFFEGNFSVKVSPGSPASPKLARGSTITAAHTSAPVQLDQVISVLDGPVRAGLVTSIDEVGHGLGGPAGQTGADGLRVAARELDGALDGIRDVAHAAQGTAPGDLRRAVASTGDTAGQLAKDPAALAALVTNYNRVVGTLASRDTQLARSVQEVAGLTSGAPADLRRIDAALPAVRRLSARLRPVLRSAPPALRSTDALLRQIGAFTAPAELPRLVERLTPVTANLPALQTQLRETLPYVGSTLGCVATHIVPTLNKEIPDGKLSTGRPVWQDLLHATTALAGASPNFDGNGTTIRLGVTESQQAFAGILPGIGEVTSTSGVPQGVRPTWLGYGVEPPYRPDADCATQALPDLSKRAGTAFQGFRPQTLPGMSGADKRIAALLRGTGTKAGRADLLGALLAGLPKAAKAAPSSAPGEDRAPKLPSVKLPAAPRPTPEGGPGSVGQTLGELLGRLTGAEPPKRGEGTPALKDVLGGLLGGRR